MTRSHLAELLDQLRDRDLAVLADIERFRLLNTRQIQRLQFTSNHNGQLGQARTCNRALNRLRDLDLVRALDRRIGGVRSGSAGYVYYLGPVGDRLQRHLRGQPGPRRRYSEPSRHFVDHTLAVAELAVQLIETSRIGTFEILTLNPEPASWQTHLNPHGVTQTLKPDLHLVTVSSDYEDHTFLEVDLATEHLPVVLRQCAAYQTYRATGRYQAAHGLFPAVLWVTPAPARAAALRAAVAATAGLDPALFRVCTTTEVIAALTSPAEGA